MAEPRAGDRFGRFELVERIGRGGNATVFRATDEGREVALKVLHTRRVDSEPYARFRREIETLRTLGERAGILPLVDSHLPEVLEKREQAWLAMPLAKRIDRALADSELPEIVGAMAGIATTLAELHATSGLAHRDLKPQNLYLYGDDFAVGDFGLVALPDAERLTAPGKVIGPANFVAYEMMESPLDADPAPADVYSLAKTLWVLATGSRWPPPGHQALGESPSVGAYRPHFHAAALDRLVDRSTRLNPVERPSMSAFAADLKAWAELPPPRQEKDLADLAALGAELRRRSAAHIDASKTTNRFHFAGHALRERFDERLEPVTTLIRESFPNVGSADGSVLTSLLQSRQALGQPTVTIRYAMGATIREFAKVHPLLLHYGGLIELIEDGNARVSVGIALGRERVLGGNAWTGEAAEAAVESLAAEALVDAAVDELVGRLPEWVQRFADQGA